MISIPLWPVLEHYGWHLPADLGRWQSVRCHIHGESRASCRVNSDVGWVVCLACGFRGNALDVIKHYEGLEWYDAVQFAAGIPGVGDSDISGRSSGIASGNIPSGTRDRPGGGRYVPPRLRGRTGRGA